MPSYQYGCKAQKDAQAKAAKQARKPPRAPDAAWLSQASHIRLHLTVLRNATTTDPDMRAHLDEALRLMMFTKKPTAKELRQRLTLVTRRLEYAFQIRIPKTSP